MYEVIRGNSMKKYRIRFEYDGTILVHVEAENEEEAVKKARRHFFENVEVQNDDTDNIYMFNGYRGYKVE